MSECCLKVYIVKLACPTACLHVNIFTLPPRITLFDGYLIHCFNILKKLNNQIQTNIFGPLTLPI